MMPYPLLWDYRSNSYRQSMHELEGKPEAAWLPLRETAFELPCRVMLDGFCQQAQLQRIRLSLAVTGIDLDASVHGAGRDLLVRLRHRVSLTITGITDQRWLNDVRALLQHLPLSLLGTGSYTLDRDQPAIRQVLAAYRDETLDAAVYQVAIGRLAQAANSSFGVLDKQFGTRAGLAAVEN